MPEIVKKKVLLLGDAAVGKTSLIRRFVVDRFSDEYIATIGTKVTKKDMRVRHRGEDVDLTLMIWDILGQKGYRAVHATSFRGAEGAMMVADISRPGTLESLKEYWIPLLWEHVGKVPIIIAGNKADLLEKPQEAAHGLEEIASNYEAHGLLTSAKTGEGVEDAFHSLGPVVLSTGRVAPVEGLRVDSDGSTLAEVADDIMMDFCREFGGTETGMPVVKQQFTAAGVDVNRPTVDHLRRAVELLAEVESSFRPRDLVLRNKNRRLAMIRRADT